MSIFKNKGKIFCIGQNKTGTTSVEAVLKKLQYKLGDQEKAEHLLYDWKNRNFKNIVKYCKSADAFQDIPFSLDYTYQILDHNFPNSKFILTVRDNKEDWYKSMTKFHANLLEKEQLPTEQDLKEFTYRTKGWLWDALSYIYNIESSEPYDFELLTQQYEKYNKDVQQYFKYRKNDLLVLNLSDPDAMQKLYTFLGHTYTGENMPHLNKSS